MSNPTPPPAAAAPQPPAKSNRTLIIVLCVVGGLLLLFGGCAVACTILVGKKAKEFSSTSQSNPAYAALSIMAAFHPDLEIVSKDEKSGLIVIKNKKTGETSNIDTTKYNKDNIGQLIENLANGKGVPVDLTRAAATSGAAEAIGDGETVSEFPEYVVPYPGASRLSMKAGEDSGMFNFGYEYSAVTDDDPAKILDFYQQSLEAAGFQISRDAPGKGFHGPKGHLTANKTDPAMSVYVDTETEFNHKVRIRITGGEMRK